MNAIDLASLPATPDLSTPTRLFQSGDHAVYWLGLSEETAFRCNVYLIVDGEMALLVDPGDRRSFGAIKARVAQIIPPEKVTGMVLCHQDPDVAASMVDWLALNPLIAVYTSMRANVLLPYFGVQNYRFVDVGLNKTLNLPSGKKIIFIEAPFLHFAGAITTFD
jgi:flavorubredoxin